MTSAWWQLSYHRSLCLLFEFTGTRKLWFLHVCGCVCVIGKFGQINTSHHVLCSFLQLLLWMTNTADVIKGMQESIYMYYGNNKYQRDEWILRHVCLLILSDKQDTPSVYICVISRSEWQWLKKHLYYPVTFVYPLFSSGTNRQQQT